MIAQHQAYLDHLTYLKEFALPKLATYAGRFADKMAEINNSSRAERRQKIAHYRKVLQKPKRTGKLPSDSRVNEMYASRQTILRPLIETQPIIEHGIELMTKGSENSPQQIQSKYREIIYIAGGIVKVYSDLIGEYNKEMDFLTMFWRIKTKS